MINLAAAGQQEEAGGARTQTALVLNKVDRVRPKAQLLETSARLHAMHAFDLPGFMISAKTGDGVNDLRNFLLLRATPGEWAVPEGVRHVQSPLQLDLMQSASYGVSGGARDSMLAGNA